jgi:hypothetical protein
MSIQPPWRASLRSWPHPIQVFDGSEDRVFLLVREREFPGAFFFQISKPRYGFRTIRTLLHRFEHSSQTCQAPIYGSWCAVRGKLRVDVPLYLVAANGLQMAVGI